MIPTLLFRAGEAITRNHSTGTSVCVSAHRDRLQVQTGADFHVPVPPRPLALSPAAASSILRSRLMVWFVLLSVADLLLTGWLLSSEGPFIEANPLAAWCLEQFGWAGLAANKAVSLLLATGGIALLARRRPRVARGTLALGCLTVALVVLRGASLAAAPALREQYQQDRIVQRREQARARRLESWLAGRKALARLRCRLSREVLAGRRSLVSAVAELEGLGLHRHPSWRHLASPLHPGDSPHSILQRQLLGQMLVDLVDGVPERQRLLARLWPIKFRGWRGGLKRYGVPSSPRAPSSSPW